MRMWLAVVQVQVLAGQRLIGHQPVQVRVGGAVHRILKGGGVLEPGGDDGGLQRGLVRKVLVQRRGRGCRADRRAAAWSGRPVLPVRAVPGRPPRSGGRQSTGNGCGRASPGRIVCSSASLQRSSSHPPAPLASFGGCRKSRGSGGARTQARVASDQGGEVDVGPGSCFRRRRSSLSATLLVGAGHGQRPEPRIPKLPRRQGGVDHRAAGELVAGNHDQPDRPSGYRSILWDLAPTRTRATPITMPAVGGQMAQRPGPLHQPPRRLAVDGL